MKTWILLLICAGVMAVITAFWLVKLGSDPILDRWAISGFFGQSAFVAFKPGGNGTMGITNGEAAEIRWARKNQYVYIYASASGNTADARCEINQNNKNEMYMTGPDGAEPKLTYHRVVSK